MTKFAADLGRGRWFRRFCRRQPC